MFDIGSSELVVIAVVAVIFIGPKELPAVLRTVGQWTGKARRMAAQFQSQFQEALREAELDDLKKSFDDVKDVATTLRGGNLMSTLANAVGPLDIDKPVTPQPVTQQPVTQQPLALAPPAAALGDATQEPAAPGPAVQASSPPMPDVVSHEAPPSNNAPAPKAGEPLALVGDAAAPPQPPQPVPPT